MNLEKPWALNRRATEFLKHFQQKAEELPTHKLNLPAGYVIDVRREDLIHPTVSGNKWRKLKYNVLTAIKAGHEGLLTFGGAHSNHIAATATAGKLANLKTIGIIRGEELAAKIQAFQKENPTLFHAEKNGMQLSFIPRKTYRQKNTNAFIEKLKTKYPGYYVIPEGGTNEEGVRGAEEILTAPDLRDYDYICVAGGTGGTAAGVIRASAHQQRVLVFSALKGDFLTEEISRFTDRQNFKVISEDRFEGYAKSNDELIRFMNDRFRESGIPLDPIYTGKMIFRLNEMLAEGTIPAESRILAIHTGGLQGVPAYNRLLVKKGRQTIDYAQ